MNNLLKVIVADDNADFRTLISDKLRGEPDFEVLASVSNGNELVDLILSTTPDVVILNNILPQLDGLGVLQTINGAEMKKRPMFFMLSSFASESLIAEANSLGVTYFLIKPFSLDTLVTRIRMFRDNMLMHQEKATEDKRTALELAVTNIIHEVGVPAHIKGYHYVREAIMMAVEDMEVINAITNDS